MKATETSFFSLNFAILFCFIYLLNSIDVSAATLNDEDLMDFDFTDLKEIDWNYDNNSRNKNNETRQQAATHAHKDAAMLMNDENWEAQLNGHGLGAITFDEVGDGIDDDQDGNEVMSGNNAIHPFDWREKILRNALAKALSNKALRQKFIEVMPILRVLSKQQRLALSALISAQVNAKKGQELKLEQVRMMFGNDKKLLIPIVYDIARLVSNAARKYLEFSYDDAQKPVAQKQQQQQIKRSKAPAISRRKLDLIDSAEEADLIGTLPSAAMPAAAAAAVDSSLEDFFTAAADDEDVLDPQIINEALQASAEKSKRARRNAAQAHAQVNAKEFVHKLIRSIPLSVNEADIQKGAAGRTVKLNTTSFALPSENDLQQPTLRTTATTSTLSTEAETNNTAPPPSYQEIEDLAFASLNGTEIHLADNPTAGDQHEAATEIEDANADDNEPLPSPEELIAGPRYRLHNNKLRIIRPKLPLTPPQLPPIVAKRKRVQVQQTRLHSRPQGVLLAANSAAAALPPLSANSLLPALRKCERFTASMCIRTDDYPL